MAKSLAFPQSKSALNAHIKRVHEKTKDFQCNACQKCFYNRQERDSHQETHYDERNYTCDICGMAFKSQPRMQKHRNVQHVLKFKFECLMEGCQQKFKIREALKRHILGSHSNQNCYYCSLCPETFLSEMVGTAHKLKVHNRAGSIRKMDNEYTKNLLSKLIGETGSSDTGNSKRFYRNGR